MCVGPPGRRSFGPGLNFHLRMLSHTFFCFKACPDLSGTKKSENQLTAPGSSKFYVLSFACAKERTKEKHTGNDIPPLPDAVIKLQCSC